MSAWEGLLPGASGVRLRARIDQGPEGAPTVLLVNGLMMAIEAWQGLATDLLGDHRVIRYDQRGQGGSDDPDGPHRIEAHAEDLVALVDALTREHGLETFHLVGLSSGVPAAVLAAAAIEAGPTGPATAAAAIEAGTPEPATAAAAIEAAAPRRVRSLTACDGFVVADAHLKLVVRAWLAAHEVGGPVHRFDVATPWVWGQAFLRDQEAALASWREAASATDPRRAHALIAGMAAFEADAGPALATLRCPVLALHGEDDVMTPARHGRALLRHAADGRLAIVREAGHAAPIERPAAVAAALRAFWAEADGGGAAAGAPVARGAGRPAATREEPR